MAVDFPANRVAKWDGTSWSALASGIQPIPYMGALVQTLMVSGSELYVGGRFMMAGGKFSAYIARAYLPALPSLSIIRSGHDVIVSWPSADTDGFALEQAAT